jgi:hypothetical protein
VKHINKANPSTNRISWTTYALNFCLDIYQSIKNLRIGKEKDVSKMSTGTLNDADTFYLYICVKIGKQPSLTRIWASKFWYAEGSDITPFGKPSDDLKTALASVGTLYLRLEDRLKQAGRDPELDILENELSEDESDGEELEFD